MLGLRLSAQPRDSPMSSSIFAIGLAGIQRGMQALQREAQTVASAPVRGFDSRDVALGLTEAQRQRRGIEASVKIIAHADRALGRLIDKLV